MHEHCVVVLLFLLHSITSSSGSSSHVCQTLCGSGPSSVRTARAAEADGECSESSVQSDCAKVHAETCASFDIPPFQKSTCLSPVPEWGTQDAPVRYAVVENDLSFAPTKKRCDTRLCCCLTGDNVIVSVSDGTMRIRGNAEGVNCSTPSGSSVVDLSLSLWEYGKSYAFVLVFGTTQLLQLTDEKLIWWPQSPDLFADCAITLERPGTKWWVYALIIGGSTLGCCVICAVVLVAHGRWRRRHGPVASHEARATLSLHDGERNYLLRNDSDD